MKNKFLIVALICIYCFSFLVPVQATSSQNNQLTSNEAEVNQEQNNLKSSAEPADQRNKKPLVTMEPNIENAEPIVADKAADKWNIKVHTKLSLTRPHQPVVSVSSQLYKLTPGSSNYQKVVKSREALYLDHLLYPNSETIYETLEQLPPGQYKLLYEANSDDKDKKYQDTKELYFTVTKESGAGSSWFADEIDQSAFLIKSKKSKTTPVVTNMRAGAVGNGESSRANWTVDIESMIVLDQPTKQPVTVTSRLYQLSADFMEELEYRTEQTLFTKQFAYQVPETLAQQFSSLPHGQYRLEILASSKQNEYETYGGMENLLFTITDQGFTAGWINDVPTDFSENSDKFSEEQACTASATSFNKQRSIEFKSTPMPSILAEGNVARQTGEGDAKLTGTWLYKNRNENYLPFRLADVEVWFKDLCETNDWEKIAITHTDEEGKFTARYPKVDRIGLWVVKVRTISGFAVVYNQDRIPYSYNRHYNDLSLGGDLGNIKAKTPGAGELTYKKAFWLYQDLIESYIFLERDKYPRKDRIQIVYDSKFDNLLNDNIVNGPSYSPIYDAVLIPFGSDRSENTIYHELAHLYQNQDYFERVPDIDCGSGNHIYYGTTEPICAWVEGWAHFVSAAIKKSEIYVYSDMTKWNLEHTTDYDHHGDSVEGRVAGALWDLYDEANDGLDTRNYPFQQILLPANHPDNNTFQDFWDRWKLLRPEMYKKAAKYSIHQNQIMYDPDRMLDFDQSVEVEGELSATFTIIGKGQSPIVSTKQLYMNVPSDVVIELYEDVDLNNMIDSSRSEDGNAETEISGHYFELGKKYYVYVRNETYGKPVDVVVKLTLVRNPRENSPYPFLEPGEAEAIPIGSAGVFAIEGDGSSITIESAYDQLWTDTVLEVYRDENLTELVIADDDSGAGTYARITNLTIPNMTVYYVKTRNFRAGEPVNATVNYAATPSSEPYGEFIGNFPWQLSSSTGLILKVIGEGKPITIETSYFLEQSDPFLELYQDEAMTELIAMDDDSAGGKYARLEQIQLNVGQTYYLKVSHFRVGTPVYALVRMKK